MIDKISKEEILQKLVGLDGRNRSRYDLLEIYVKKYGAREILTEYFWVVEEGFGLVRVLPNPSNVLRFLCDLIKFAYTADLGNVRNRLDEMVVQGLFCDETRQMISESILVPVFKECKGAFIGFKL